MPIRQLLITDSEITKLFKGADFGMEAETPGSRRWLMAECVLKCMCDYSGGHTISMICYNAGLLTSNFNPTRAGRRWVYSIISDRCDLH